MNIFKVSHLQESTHGVPGWNFWHENDFSLPIKERTICAFGYGFKGIFYGGIDIGNVGAAEWLIGAWDMDLGHPVRFINTRTLMGKKSNYNN